MKTEDQLVSFINGLLGFFHLAYHEVNIAKEPADDDDVYATIHVDDERYAFMITLCKDFYDLPEERQRRVLVHEVLHVTHRRVETAVSDIVYASAVKKSTKIKSSEWISFHREMELWVDLMSESLADLAEVKRLWHAALTQS